jgi:hypothetical protein
MVHLPRTLSLILPLSLPYRNFHAMEWFQWRQIAQCHDGLVVKWVWLTFSPYDSVGALVRRLVKASTRVSRGRCGSATRRLELRTCCVTATATAFDKHTNGTSTTTIPVVRSPKYRHLRLHMTSSAPPQHRSGHCQGSQSPLGLADSRTDGSLLRALYSIHQVKVLWCVSRQPYSVLSGKSWLRPLPIDRPRGPDDSMNKPLT